MRDSHHMRPITSNRKICSKREPQVLVSETLMSDIPKEYSLYQLKEYPTSHWYFLSVHTSLYFLAIHMSLKASVYTKKIQVTSSIIGL